MVIKHLQHTEVNFTSHHNSQLMDLIQVDTNGRVDRHTIKIRTMNTKQEEMLSSVTAMEREDKLH